MGSITKPMTADEKRVFEALVKDSFDQFKKVIRSGRSEFAKDPKKLDDLATGQIYTAEQAKKHGLIDDIGFLEKAVDKAIELAHLDGNKVKVVRYKQEAGLGSILLGGQSSKSESAEVKALLEMTTPKAYYLASWLPGLAGAAK